MRQNKPKQVFLCPGELHVHREPIIYVTVLGSCVAVCLFNKKYKFGGINHYQLSNPSSSEKNYLRYGSYSIKKLIKQMQKEDDDLSNLEAYIFGGGCVADNLPLGEQIANDNILIAQDILRKNKIKISKIETGKKYGQKVFFCSWNGNTKIEKVNRISNSDINKCMKDGENLLND